MMAVTFYMFKLMMSRFATNKHDLKGWFSFSVVTHYRTGRSPPRASNTGYNLANITVMSSHQSYGWIWWIWISDHIMTSIKLPSCDASYVISTWHTWIYTKTDTHNRESMLVNKYWKLSLLRRKAFTHLHFTFEEEIIVKSSVLTRFHVFWKSRTLTPRPGWL